MLKPRAKFAARLLNWYVRARRDLPWRPARDSDPSILFDAYAVLVSELMLQQTQVATVVPYFHRFMARFPTAALLAAAQEQEVLRLWQGLGYYSRARNLLAAARQITEKHGGNVPSSLDDLLELPGVGRYTAGAVASIAYGKPVPILDGNVARVICRLDKIASDPRQPKTVQHLWKRAEQILPTKRAGDFNSALMELGATICTPRSPSCLICPVQSFCESFAAGVQLQIPQVRRSRPTPLHRRWTFCLHRRGKYLIEQRPSTGRWAGLWQFITLDASTGPPMPDMLKKHLGHLAASFEKIGQLSHALTHRRYIFEIFIAPDLHRIGTPSPSRRWISLDDLNQFPLPTPHLKVAAMLRTRDNVSPLSPVKIA